MNINSTEMLSKEKPKITIACLIFRSTRWLKFVYDQVKKYTDLSDKEFFFIANDANENVLNYLINNKIPHYINTITEEQRKEWYINNVYRGYNKAIEMAKGEYLVLINSDMAFSPNWLESLMKNYNDNRIVNSRLVERGYLRSGMYGIERNFGSIPENYQENEFQDYITSIKENELKPGGLYMPFLMKTEYFRKINCYPEGNIVPNSNIFFPEIAKIGEPCIPGDKVFIEKLRIIGIEHYTDFNSIVYHFQQGEMNDTI